MKHHIIEPIAKSATSDSLRPQRPGDLKSIVEDPIVENRDMSLEQQAAFVSPAHEEKRVLQSQADQGRK